MNQRHVYSLTYGKAPKDYKFRKKKRKKKKKKKKEADKEAKFEGQPSLQYLSHKAILPRRP